MYEIVYLLVSFSMHSSIRTLPHIYIFMNCISICTHICTGWAANVQRVCPCQGPLKYILCDTDKERRTIYLSLGIFLVFRTIYSSRGRGRREERTTSTKKKCFRIRYILTKAYIFCLYMHTQAQPTTGKNVVSPPAQGPANLVGVRVITSV